MFPLFDQLSALTTDWIHSIPFEERGGIVQGIKQMNEHEHEIVFALIRAYQLQNETIHCILPFNGKHQKKGIKFDFDCFPLALQHVIHQFVKKSSQREESSLSNKVIVP